MLFFRSLLTTLIFLMSGALYASDIKEIIVTKEYGSCKTNNLSFSAMKFYKIPLNEKYENYDLYLRVILFFNKDDTLTMRLTTQALLGCQDTACSFYPVKDSWQKGQFKADFSTIQIPSLGEISFFNQEDTNRGFEMTFANNNPYPVLNGLKFIGGMVSTNFNQNGENTINICR